MDEKGMLMVYVNGKIVPENEAVVSVYDRGFVYGDGCFEGIAVYEGGIFQLNEHIERLFRSMKALKIEGKLTKEYVKKAILHTYDENLARGINGISYLRLIATRGVGPLGVEQTFNVKEPSLVIIPAGKSIGMYPRTRVSSERAEKGAKMKIVSLRRIPPQSLDAKIKTLNYLNQILSRIEAMENGADDGILLDVNGFVSEATGENIFLVKDNELFTPPTNNILVGITRGTIIQLVRKRTITVHETLLTSYDLYNADEVFATGTIAGILPIIEIDGRTINDGSPGRMTKMLTQDWESLTRDPRYLTKPS